MFGAAVDNNEEDPQDDASNAADARDSAFTSTSPSHTQGMYPQSPHRPPGAAGQGEGPPAAACLSVQPAQGLSRPMMSPMMPVPMPYPYAPHAAWSAHAAATSAAYGQPCGQIPAMPMPAMPMVSPYAPMYHPAAAMMPPSAARQPALPMSAYARTFVPGDPRPAQPETGGGGKADASSYEGIYQ